MSSKTTNYGMCLACRSVDVALLEVIGTTNAPSISPSPRYPLGYGCEACA